MFTYGIWHYDFINACIAFNNLQTKTGELWRKLKYTNSSLYLSSVFVSLFKVANFWLLPNLYAGAIFHGFKIHYLT